MSDTSRLIFLIIVLVLAAPGFFYAMRRPGALRNAVIWIAAFTALVIGYNYYQARQNPQPAEPGGYIEGGPVSDEPAPVRNI